MIPVGFKEALSAIRSKGVTNVKVGDVISSKNKKEGASKVSFIEKKKKDVEDEVSKYTKEVREDFVSISDEFKDYFSNIDDLNSLLSKFKDNDYKISQEEAEKSQGLLDANAAILKSIKDQTADDEKLNKELLKKDKKYKTSFSEPKEKDNSKIIDFAKDKLYYVTDELSGLGSTILEGLGGTQALLLKTALEPLYDKFKDSPLFQKTIGKVKGLFGIGKKKDEIESDPLDAGTFREEIDRLIIPSQSEIKKKKIKEGRAEKQIPSLLKDESDITPSDIEDDKQEELLSDILTSSSLNNENIDEVNSNLSQAIAIIEKLKGMSKDDINHLKKKLSSIETIDKEFNKDYKINERRAELFENSIKDNHGLLKEVWEDEETFREDIMDILKLMLKRLKGISGGDGGDGGDGGSGFIGAITGGITMAAIRYFLPAIVSGAASIWSVVSTELATVVAPVAALEGAIVGTAIVIDKVMGGGESYFDPTVWDEEAKKYGKMVRRNTLKEDLKEQGAVGLFKNTYGIGREATGKADVSTKEGQEINAKYYNLDKKELNTEKVTLKEAVSKGLISSGDDANKFINNPANPELIVDGKNWDEYSNMPTKDFKVWVQGHINDIKGKEQEDVKGKTTVKSTNYVGDIPDNVIEVMSKSEKSATTRNQDISMSTQIQKMERDKVAKDKLDTKYKESVINKSNQKSVERVPGSSSTVTKRDNLGNIPFFGDNVDLVLTNSGKK